MRCTPKPVTFVMSGFHRTGSKLAGTHRAAGHFHHYRAMGGGSVLEADAVHAEAGDVRDERIPSDRIEASGHAPSGPPFTCSVDELLVDAHVAVLVGEVVNVMADAFGNRTCRLSAPYVDVQCRQDIPDQHRIQGTPFP